jgi:hypothetical protein
MNALVMFARDRHYRLQVQQKTIFLLSPRQTYCPLHLPVYFSQFFVIFTIDMNATSPLTLGHITGSVRIAQQLIYIGAGIVNDN